MTNTKKIEQEKDFFDLGVDQEVINEAKAQDEFTIELDLDDDSYTEVIENIQGSLILTCELPQTYHGVYYWNNGEFPYIIKPELKRVVLVCDQEVLPMTIKSVKPQVGVRFRFDHKLKRSVEDPNGESCIWRLIFTLQKEQ